MKKLTFAALLLLTHVCSADIVRTYTGTSTTVCTTVNGTGTSWECTETCTWKSVITATATNKITVGVESSPGSTTGPIATITDVNGAPILVGGVLLTLEPSTVVTEQLQARYGAISTAHSWHGFTTNVPLTAGGPVGSQAVFKLKFEWPVIVSPQGSIFFSDDGAGAEADFGSIPPFCPNPISYSGLAHCPAGEAAVTVTAGSLNVSNIGSSGLDGVEIDLPNVSHWEARWAPLDPTNSLPVGAFVRSAIFGSAGTVTNDLLGSWRLIKLGSNDYGVTANFAPIGATTVTAQIYNGDTLVTTVPGQTGQFIRVNGCVDDDHWGNPTPSGPFGLPGKFGGALTFLAPQQFTFSNGSSATGDRLIILPDDAPQVTSLSKAMVVAKDIPNINIDHERHFLNFKGLAHGSLGQANLRKGDSLLTVSNLGSSGQDGVSVSLRDTEAFITEIPLEPGMPVGGYMVSNFTGPNTLGTMVPRGKIGMRRLADSMAAIVDFSDLESPTYTATVYRAGVPVLTGSGLSGEVVQMTAGGGIKCTYDFKKPCFIWDFNDLFGSSSAAFTIPGAGTNVPGDKIVFTPDVSLTTQIRPTQVDITGAEMPMFQFSGEAIRKFGIDQTGMGTATLTPTTSGLLVSNLGSSGQDGVEVNFSPTFDHMAVEWENPDQADQLPVGASARIRLLGYGGGLLFTKTASHAYALNADLATSGAPSWTVEVYDGKNLVQTLPGQTNPLIGTMSIPIVEVSWGKDPVTNCYYFDIKINPKGDFNLSNGSVVLGDRIVVRPDGGLLATEHDKAQITTTQIPSLNIVRAEKTLSYGGLAHTSIGQANLDIVSTTTDDWYRCPGLSVSNIGSSGEDGVSIKLPANQSFTTQTFADPAAPPGALMKSTTFAGGASTPIEVVGMQRVGTGFGAIVDFSGLGSPTYTAKVFNKGIYVGGAGGLTNGDVTFSFLSRITITCTRDYVTKCWTWTIHVPPLFDLAAFSIPGAGGGGPLSGDQILFIPDQLPAAPITTPRMEIVGANMPEFTILSESLRLNGLEHTGLGAAAMDISGTTGALQLWNLGSSGQDGVSVHLGEAGYGTLGLQPGPAATRVDGSFVEMTARAKFNGVEDSPMVIGRLEDVGDQYALSARYMPGLQGSGLRVDLYNGETLVDTKNQAMLPSGSTGELLRCPDPRWTYDWIWWLVDTLGSMQSIVSSDVPVPVTLPGHSSVMADRIVISLLQPTGTFSHLSDVEVRSTGLSGMSVFDAELGMFHHSHRAVGAASIIAEDGKLFVGNLGSSGQDGVSVELGKAASADFKIDTFWCCAPDPQPKPKGKVKAQYRGSVNGVPDQPLGDATVTALNDGSGDYELAADLSPLGSPTLRIEVWDGNTLVVALPGVPGGVFGRASRWPSGGGKTGLRFGDWVLGCISWDYPLVTNFNILNTNYSGTRLLMLQESPPTANYLSSYSITATGLTDNAPGRNGFILTDETSTPLLPPPSGFARIRFDCTYKLIPPTCTWTIVRSTTTLPDAFAGVVYHLQEAVQVPTDYSNLQLVVSGSSGSVPFELSPNVAAKAQALHPAPSGYVWVGFQSLETFGNNSAASLLEVYSSRVTFGTADPAITAGASWFGSDAPAGSGHPSGEIYQAFAAGPPPDLDGDDIPDSWEITYGLNPNLTSDAALDLDGDGTSNWLEYLAGTNPTNSASVLRLSILSASPESVHLQFEAALGKTYVIEESSGLSTWETTQIIPSATVPQTTDVVRPYPPPKRFFRVRMAW